MAFPLLHVSPARGVAVADLAPSGQPGRLGIEWHSGHDAALSRFMREGANSWKRAAAAGFLAGLAGGLVGAMLWALLIGQSGRYQYVRSGNAGFLVDTAKGDVLFRPLPGEGYRMFNLRTGRVGRRASSGEDWEFKSFEESWSGAAANDEDGTLPPVESASGTSPEAR